VRSQTSRKKAGLVADLRRSSLGSDFNKMKVCIKWDNSPSLMQAFAIL
jgi:hypothetical protein